MKRKMLTEDEGYALLEEYSIQVPKFRLTQNADEAARAAGEIGYPVVMKIRSSDVIHKTESGGIVTGIENPDDVKSAFGTILKNVRTRFPGAEIDGILVETQMPPGLEVLIGGKTDPSFGKVITFGIGGTLVELIRDVSIRVLPLQKGDAERLIRGTLAERLIQGYRGEPKKDMAALSAAIEGLSRLFLDHPEISEFDVNPLIVYKQGICAVDARFITEGTGEPESDERRTAWIEPGILAPKSIAVVGASSDPKKVGYAIFRNLLQFTGRLYPVNPNRAEILCRQVYPTLTDIPDDIDCVVIAVPSPAVSGILEEAGRKGVKLAVIVSSGFGEAGTKGQELEASILEIARRLGIRILGPNCLGFMIPHLGINATFNPITPKNGHIAFISQSGAVIATVVDWSLPEDIGFSAVISIGNQADLGFEHFLRVVEQDPETRAIILYVEEIRDGKSFMDVVNQISASKPVVVIKSGASVKGRQAAASHTGSLAGSYEVYTAALTQAGAIPVNSIRDAFNLAELLVSEGYPHGNRAVIITSAGGFAVLASDYAERFGVDLIELPDTMLDELNSFLPATWSHANPMDIIGDAGVDRFAHVFDVMIKNQDEWDIAFIIAIPSAVSDPVQIAHEIVRFSRNTEKMIVGGIIGGDSIGSAVHILRKHSIPNFSDLEDAFKTTGIILTRQKRYLDQ